MLAKINKPLALIVLLGIIIRIISVYPYNTIIGFDQARDLMDAITIYRDANLRIIGPTAGNNPFLHHGVLFLYYLVPPLFISDGNPMAAVYWNIVFNALSVVVIYFLALSLFKQRRIAFIAAISYYFVQFAGWLSNPSPTLLTAPLFFLGLWNYFQRKSWGLIVAALALGISIQLEFFFIYLGPIGLIYWLMLKPKLPKIKLLLVSLAGFLLITSTMIVTQLRYGINGITAFFNAGKLVGASVPLGERLLKFIDQFSITFSNTILPHSKTWALLLVLVGLGTILYKITKQKSSNDRSAMLFLLLYTLSPAVMLIIGSHNAPWFLIGLPPALVILSAYIIAQIKSATLIIVFLGILFWSNLAFILPSSSAGQALLEPDKSAHLASQLEAIDYTYTSSGNSSFAIDTVTNPLYINAIWSYHYMWYGNAKYGYKPTWLGGDQKYPYDTIAKDNGLSTSLFVIVDDTPRIPLIHKLLAVQSAKEKGSLVEEKSFGELKVYRLQTN